MTAPGLIGIVLGIIGMSLGAGVALAIIWASLWGRHHPACKPEGGVK